MRTAHAQTLRHSKLAFTRCILLRMLNALTFVSWVTGLCCAVTAQTSHAQHGQLNARDFAHPRSFQQPAHAPTPEPHLPQGRITAIRALPPDAPIIERRGQSEDVSPGNVVVDEFVPWWAELVNRPRRLAEQSELVTVEMLVARALHQSPQVMAMSRGPLIEQTRIIESQAAFDLHVFMDTAFDRASDPVGNELQTGGPPRFREEDWNYTAGARRNSLAAPPWRPHSVSGTSTITPSSSYRVNRAIPDWY